MAADRPGAVLAVVAAGGALGSLSRWSLSEVAGPAAMPWAFFGINVAGCLLIGVTMVALTEVATTAHPLLRPFLGPGLLGGFTTMSAFADQVVVLAQTGQHALALGYLVGTVLSALLATAVGIVVMRAAMGVRPVWGRRA